MAAKDSQVLAEIDENFLLCGICSERYKNAKILPCLHSFCEPCLGKLAEKSGVITCPVCRRSHELTHKGVAGISANDFLNGVVELFTKRESADESKNCGGCEQFEATTHCIECDFELCNTCAKTHSKIRSTKSHRLVSLDEYHALKVH